MAKYVLISVCEREITATFFGTVNEARNQMRKEYRETEYKDDGEIDKMSAWANGDQNNDWLIVPIE